MAAVVKWLTHLAVNQTFEGSIPFGRPIYSINADAIGFFYYFSHLMGRAHTFVIGLIVTIIKYLLVIYEIIKR